MREPVVWIREGHLLSSCISLRTDARDRARRCGVLFVFLWGRVCFVTRRSGSFRSVGMVHRTDHGDILRVLRRPAIVERDGGSDDGRRCFHASSPRTTMSNNRRARVLIGRSVLRRISRVLSMVRLCSIRTALVQRYGGTRHQFHLRSGIWIQEPRSSLCTSPTDSILMWSNSNVLLFDCNERTGRKKSPRRRRRKFINIVDRRRRVPPSAQDQTQYCRPPSQKGNCFDEWARILG